MMHDEQELLFQEIDNHIDTYDDLIEDHVDKTYQIGICITTENSLEYLAKFPSFVFFQYPLVNYIHSYKRPHSKASLDIFQVHELADGTRLPIVKTYWIRLIQRTWRKLYEYRRRYIQSSNFQAFIANRELYGNIYKKYKYPLLPGLLTMAEF
jgi:hypothetical protein